jgi:hypothetical protein
MEGDGSETTVPKRVAGEQRCLHLKQAIVLSQASSYLEMDFCKSPIALLAPSAALFAPSRTIV